jgi:hypothetical protein
LSAEPPTSSPPPGAQPLWGSYEGGAASAPTVSKSSRPARGTRQALTRPSLFGDGPLEPLSVRLLQVAGALSLLLILVVVNSFLHSGENPLNPVAAAAERTADVDGLRFTMVVRTASEADPPRLDYEKGSLNLQTKLGAVQVSGETADGAHMQADMVVSEDAIYLRSPEFRGKLPEGKEWTKMKPSLLTGEDSVPAESPDGSLGMLTVNNRVHRAGHSQVRGVRVSRYVSSFEIGDAVTALRAHGEDELAEKCEKLASQVVGPVRAVALIDGKGLVRSVRVRMTSTASGTPETIESLTEFFDFGAQPDIVVPPESRVFDMTPVMEQQREALGQSS